MISPWRDPIGVSGLIASSCTSGGGVISGDWLRNGLISRGMPVAVGRVGLGLTIKVVETGRGDCGDKEGNEGLRVELGSWCA